MTKPENDIAAGILGCLTILLFASLIFMFFGLGIYFIGQATS